MNAESVQILVALVQLLVTMTLFLGGAILTTREGAKNGSSYKQLGYVMLVVAVMCLGVILS